MLVPRIFNNNFMDNFFDDAFSFPSFKSTSGSTLMSTDVKDLGNKYQLDIELPGYKKENVSAELKDGYLVISAKKEEHLDEKDESGNYIRRERYSGNCHRSFYVGNHLKEEDIHASFEDGILKLEVPKEEESKNIPEKKQIYIN